jgi:hypothetical protein
VAAPRPEAGCQCDIFFGQSLAATEESFREGDDNGARPTVPPKPVATLYAPDVYKPHARSSAPPPPPPRTADGRVPAAGGSVCRAATTTVLSSHFRPAGLRPGERPGSLWWASDKQLLETFATWDRVSRALAAQAAGSDAEDDAEDASSDSPSSPEEDGNASADEAAAEFERGMALMDARAAGEDYDYGHTTRMRH